MINLKLFERAFELADTEIIFMTQKYLCVPMVYWTNMLFGQPVPKCIPQNKPLQGYLNM